MRIGLREANQSFSKVINAVKAGKDVILIERGKPMPIWRSPVRIKGKPISRTISEERDER
jgi:hypothetical protein